ncbi:hypothetical protein FNV43_RR26252 [Rhamnella rubrinervis]|uniref:Uncharacterized protein n=1 Tax=Rhamnella rubrinervis TaxID=2594499 RepID=A0A8K0DML4_9ROSA|nr:hypothetical protein FNV43_RR26252 [Rhamnella rubrinervis]
MAATRHLYAVTSRRLVPNSGYRGCDPLMDVHGMHRRMFSTRGTPAAGGLEAPPQNYNQDYHKPPDHHYINQDYYNPSVNHSKISRDEYFNNMSDQKHHLSEKDYEFKKLQQRIFRMEHDFARHCEKLHRYTVEIRDENEKLTNNLRFVLRNFVIYIYIYIVLVVFPYMNTLTCK